MIPAMVKIRVPEIRLLFKKLFLLNMGSSRG